MGILEAVLTLLAVTMLMGTVASVKDDTDTESKACFLCVELNSQDHPALEESAQEGKEALPVLPVDPPAALPRSLR